MKFNFICKTKDGGVKNGLIEAPNEAAAAKALQEQDLFVVSLKSEKDFSLSNISSGSIKIPFISSVSLKDKIIFTEQLAMMMRSGLPLIDSFVTLGEQTENKNFAKIIAEITKEVRGGKPLSAALSKHPDTFSKFYVSIVAAGEKSGKVDEVLTRLAEEQQKDYELMSKIKAAVTYPILIMFTLVGIVVLMMIFVIPSLKTIFADMGVELPIITRIVLKTSDIMRNYWYLFIIVIIGLFLLIRFGARTNRGSYMWDSFKIRIPVVGKLIKKIYMTRFCRTTGTLVASGLPILNILQTGREVIGNKLYQIALKQISADIENGETFSDALKKQPLFPPMLYHLVSVGEKSGKLDEILLSTAGFFDREVETSTSNMATLIEPILIIIVGAGVGLVVASVIMPIYSLVNVI